MSYVYLFAYGTLKVGEFRHHLIKDMPVFNTEIKGFNSIHIPNILFQR
jgi:gamma-glutamylcyclotransferase (GGCT)/AIG2-like uncharacterized protein YtfP